MKEILRKSFSIFLAIFLIYILWTVFAGLSFAFFFLIRPCYSLQFFILIFPFLFCFLFFKNKTQKILFFLSGFSFSLLVLLFSFFLIENGINWWIVFFFAFAVFLIFKLKRLFPSLLPFFFLSLFILLIVSLLLSTPPKISKVKKFKGIWSPFQSYPSPFSFHRLIDFPKRLKDLNANSVALARTYPVWKGKIHKIPLEKFFLMLRAKYLELNGIYFQYNLEIAKFHKTPHQPLLKIANSPEFQNQLKKVIIENAKLAQNLGAESLVPFIEAEIILGTKESSKILKEVLPEIKKVYFGKVVWWGAFKGHTTKEAEKIDFSGYDILCFTHSPWMENKKVPRKEHKKILKEDIETLEKVAKNWKLDLAICELCLFEKEVKKDYVENFYLPMFANKNLKGIFIIDFMDFPLTDLLTKDHLFANLYSHKSILEKIKALFSKL